MMGAPTTRDRLERAPDFVMVGGGELQRQRGLSLLARVLLLELLAIADHATGAVRTSYMALEVVCGVDPAANGRTRDDVTRRRLRDALDELEAKALVRRDAVRNEKTGALFLRLPGRAGLSAPKGEEGRVSAGCGQPKIRVPTSTYQRRHRRSGQGLGQVAQEPSSLTAKHVLGGSYPQGSATARADRPAEEQLGQAPPRGPGLAAAPPRPPAAVSRPARAVWQTQAALEGGGLPRAELPAPDGGAPRVLGELLGLDPPPDGARRVADLLAALEARGLPRPS
ncbi:hypothetical protein JI742_09915 [Piscinibacter sp. Jin2]|uniref:Uncharacterized protein n=1 Tax=Aquariibacter lacus TaxID=2801332 RepID=A0A9X0XE03_9BURK|nr:hypothetical protein [Piscinibacter lacus]MBL0720205.1 hypothetical protein [Piscinibacter lacus]